MSYKFKPRTTAPSRLDKNWIHWSKGGRNYCILIKGNSVLPNCVGYAWGRFMEILGRLPKLSKGNAEDWYGNRADGYQRGQRPRLGAVICWRKGRVGNGSDGAGHVAIVEKIFKDGSLLVSESGYKASKRFWTTKIPATFERKGYVFQGFIYNPAVPYDDKPAHILKSVDTVAREVIRGLWGNGAERKKRLQEAGYDYQAVQNRVNELLAP